jgi:A/G-specific adenine glycosylase
MNRERFNKQLIDWYQSHHRALPWRETRDPYKIWLSEIILQQTRVAQGLPYYQKFVAAFPTVQALAQAEEQKVLRLWQGLGYYSRARNLHACAKMIVRDFNGKFPDHNLALTKLPGVGPYTAAAIASFAFRERVAVVDGNVFRVLARIFGIDVNIASPEGKKVFTAKANLLIDDTRPDLFNQSIMEFGATHCTPVAPQCDHCIFSRTCVANLRGLQKLLPVKEKKLTVRKRYFCYVSIRYKNKWLMKKREGKDIWHGLYDFFLVESKSKKNWQTAIAKHLEFVNGKRVGEFKHVLTHQQLFATFIDVELKDEKEFVSLAKKFTLMPFTQKQVDNLPKPVLISKYFESFLQP